jgi:hypothetical protein
VELESELWENALAELPFDVQERILADPFVEAFYHEAFWDWDLAGDTRADVYENFIAYMEDEYGVEWEEIFDWDDWRQAYDDAH